jgi:predicted transcriptional regulator of viral defense system
MKASEPIDRLLAFARQKGSFHTRDLSSLGIARVYLRRLCDLGFLVKHGRGVYEPANATISEHHSLALAAVAVPRGVICLLSALRFYGLGTQAPHQVWMAIARESAIPRLNYPPMRFLRVSGAAFDEGRIIQNIDGVSVCMTTPAKTVADCFKFRGQIGKDVAIEALREVLSKRLATVDEIWIQAGHCRVAKVIRPYLEAIV